MKILKNISITIAIIVLALINQSCKDQFLQEDPPATFSNVSVLDSEKGFEIYMTALHEAARNEMAARDSPRWFYINWAATDVADFGNDAVHSTDYNNLLTPSRSLVEWLWDWAYQQMILRSNTIISYAEQSAPGEIWQEESEKNAVIAEAKFFRAYTYNLLANTFRGVPIVDTTYSSPKTDFVRASREEVLEFAKQDLEFASQWLPTTVPTEQEGRIVKAAADHLLTEVYISLGQYEKAVESADNVIDSGLYHLMTGRFGSETDQPGDVFSDLFRDGNQNRSSGNMESIYVWQFEDLTPGGQGNSNGNNRLRNWGPWYERITDPDGNSGMVIVDSLGRGVGQVRPTSYSTSGIWKSDWNDMRNSVHNMRRVFRYTNPQSNYFGQIVDMDALTSEIDTMQNLYPYPRKIEGNVGARTHTGTSWSGRTYQDFMVYRLAETYLLRAEAYFRMGDLQSAADDINKVRARANASLINPSDVNEGFILDERARELIAETPRRRHLVRMGKLVERVRKYGVREVTRNSIQDYHRWWPIPQDAIDANIGAELEQNPGY